MFSRITGYFTALLVVLFYYRIRMLLLALEMPPAEVSYGLFFILIWLPDIFVAFILSLPFIFSAPKENISGAQPINLFVKVYRLILAFTLPLFLLISTGYFRLYESPFQMGVLRTEFSVIYKELLASFLAEVRGADILFFVTGLVFVYSGPVWFRVAGLRFSKNIKPVYFVFLLMFFASSITYFAGGQATKHPEPEKAKLLEKALTGIPFNIFEKSKSVAESSIPDYEKKFIPGFSLKSPYSSVFYKEVRDIPRGQKYNIIFYYFESITRKRMFDNYQGRPVAPVLLKLRQNSLEAVRHYANFPLSINAFYSSFCSAYALPDGRWVSLIMPDISVECISEILKKQGYSTGLLHAGYLEYARQDRFLKNRKLDLVLNAPELKKKPYQTGLGPWGAADERAMIKPMKEFIKKSGDNPFFLAMFAFNPHHPYFTGNDYKPLVKDTTQGNGQRERALLRYYNSLNFADYALGEIINELEKTDKLDNTLVFIFGDHGEAFYEHPGNFNHPFHVYEENVHVPFMIYNKKIFPQHKELKRISTHIDIVPTVLDILALPKNKFHEGTSMFKPGSARFAEIQAYWHTEQNAIRDEKYKYIRQRSTGNEWLFDLENDPEEKINLKLTEPSATKTYRTLLENSATYKRLYYYHLAGYKPSVKGKPSDQDN